MITLEQFKNIKVDDKIWWFSKETGIVYSSTVVDKSSEETAYFLCSVDDLNYIRKNSGKLYSVMVEIFDAFIIKEAAATFLLEKANAFRKQALKILEEV